MRKRTISFIVLIGVLAACKTAVKSVDPGGSHNIPKGTRLQDKDTSVIKLNADTLNRPQ